MAKLLLSREALEDLDLVWNHIAQDNPEAADQVLNAAYRTCQMLGEHPDLGRLREFQNSALAGMRSFVITDFPNYAIFYQILGETVQIVRVVHGARNIDGLFDSSQSH